MSASDTPGGHERVQAVKAFKYRLDKHWSNQDVLFDFNADLTCTGSIPICMRSYVTRDPGKDDYLRPSEHIGLDCRLVSAR